MAGPRARGAESNDTEAPSLSAPTPLCDHCQASEQFDERPRLLSTNPAENAFLADCDLAADFSFG